jgi:hypothetical protein
MLTLRYRKKWWRARHAEDGEKRRTISGGGTLEKE